MTVPGEELVQKPPNHAQRFSRQNLHPYKVTDKAKEELETVKVRLRKHELLGKNRDFRKGNYKRGSNYTGPKHSFRRLPDIEPATAFKVLVKVYNPFTWQNDSYNQLKLSHELVLLGSNTLDMLRDHILCSSVNFAGASQNMDLDSYVEARKVPKQVCYNR